MKRARNHLATYLNDHLAGAVAVVNFLDHLQKTKAGQSMQKFLAELRADILADRKTLETVMDRAGVKKHKHRTAAAWLVEKLTRFKLRQDDSGDGTLYLLEALELVETGIEGKRELWRSMAASTELLPPVQGINFEHLARRAEEQHDRVEAVRLDAAKTALVSTS